MNSPVSWLYTFCFSPSSNILFIFSMSWIVISFRLFLIKYYLLSITYLDVWWVQPKPVLLVDYLVQDKIQILHTPKTVCLVLSWLTYQMARLRWSTHSQFYSYFTCLIISNFYYILAIFLPIPYYLSIFYTLFFTHFLHITISIFIMNIHHHLNLPLKNINSFLFIFFLIFKYFQSQI